MKHVLIKLLIVLSVFLFAPFVYGDVEEDMHYLMLYSEDNSEVGFIKNNFELGNLKTKETVDKVYDFVSLIDDQDPEKKDFIRFWNSINEFIEYYQSTDLYPMLFELKRKLEKLDHVSVNEEGQVTELAKGPRAANERTTPLPESYLNPKMGLEEFLDLEPSELLDEASKSKKFLKFSEFKFIKGVSGAGSEVYSDKEGSIWFVKGGQSPFKEYLGYKLMNLLLGPWVSEVRLFSDTDSRIASKLLEGFVVESQSRDWSKKTVVGEMRRDLAMELIGLFDRHTENLGYIDLGDVVVAARIDFDDSFAFDIENPHIGTLDPHYYNKTNLDSIKAEGLTFKDILKITFRRYKDRDPKDLEEEIIDITNIPDDLILATLREGYADILSAPIFKRLVMHYKVNVNKYKGLGLALIARKHELAEFIPYFESLVALRKDLMEDPNDVTPEEIDLLNSLTKEIYGTSALHWASSQGMGTVVEYILKFEEVDALDLFGDTPLHWAVASGKFDIVKLLLKKGADPEFVSKGYHVTPLLIASKEGSLDIAKLLVKFGADVDRQLPLLKSSGIHYPLKEAVLHNNAKIVEFLLKENANPAGYEYNPLILNAAEGGFLDIVKTLENAGQQLDSKVLNSAIYGEKIHVIKYLFDQGLQASKSELDRAAITGNLEVIELVIDNLDPNEPFRLDAAVATQNEVVVDLFIEKGAIWDDNIVSKALYGNVNPDFVEKVLTQLKVTPDSDALGWAITSSSFEDRVKLTKVVELLLKAGADPNATYRGKSMLDIARENDYPEGEELLIKYGAK